MKKPYQNLPCENKAVKAGEKTVCKSRGLKLLPYAIRENLPVLGFQQSKGGQAKVIAKCFTGDGWRVWHITEGSARRDTENRAVDYLLYGLVEGQCRKLDYFWLSDLATLRSPTGLPVQRDSHWRPKLLQEIAPEMFQIDNK
jgi:hypothetical protein